MNNLELLNKKELLKLLKSNPIVVLEELNKRRIPTIFEQVLNKCPKYKKYFELVGISSEGYEGRVKEKEIVKRKLYDYAMDMGYINMDYEDFIKYT